MLFRSNTLHLLLLIAAVWRLSNLIAQKEEGPFRILWLPHQWARRTVRKNKNGLFAKSRILDALECEYCLSIWFGTALTAGYFLLGEILVWLILPLALSAGAILVKHIIFLVKSVDTRYDQQNQAYLANQKTLEVLANYRDKNNETYTLEESVIQSIFEERRR